jgi:hypothetical protein
MARYLIEEEGPDGQAISRHGPFDGLAVARAMAQKWAQQNDRVYVVRDAESGETVARCEPARKGGQEPPLARSVRRMRAANDRLKQALNTPAGGARGGERK